MFSALLQSLPSVLVERYAEVRIFEDSYRKEELEARIRAGEKIELRAASDLDLLSRYDWFKLEPETERIYRAFRSFASRVRGRIKDKIELRTIVESLRGLSAYWYSMLPEIADRGKQEKGLGEQGLMTFVRAVDALPEYAPEPKALTPEERLENRVRSKAASISALFSNSNVLVCFLAWLVLLTVLVSVALLLSKQLIPSLRFETTLLAMAIATPIGGAATLAAVAFMKSGEGRPKQ
jgi:hypothetical protein